MAQRPSCIRPKVVSISLGTFCCYGQKQLKANLFGSVLLFLLIIAPRFSRHQINVSDEKAIFVPRTIKLCMRKQEIYLKTYWILLWLFHYFTHCPPFMDAYNAQAVRIILLDGSDCSMPWFPQNDIAIRYHWDHQKMHFCLITLQCKSYCCNARYLSRLTTCCCHLYFAKSMHSDLHQFTKTF